MQLCHQPPSCASKLSASKTHACAHARAQHARPRLPVAAASQGSAHEDESEDAAYNELLARKREARTQAIREASRRARFNPLNRKAQEQQQQAQPPEPAKQQPPTQQPRPASSSRSSKQRTASAAAKPLRPASLSMQRRRGSSTSSKPTFRAQQQLRAADSSEDEDGGDDDIDAATLQGLQSVAAQLMQEEARLQELDVEVDGERGRAGASRAAARGQATQQQQGLRDAGEGASSSSISASSRGPARGAGGAASAALGSRAAGMRGRDPFQDPAFLQRLEALMQDDSDSEDDDDDDVIDVDAGSGVPGQARGSASSGNKGLLSSMPGGERINHKELADMEDIDWDALVEYESLERGVEQQQQQELQAAILKRRQQVQQAQQQQHSQPLQRQDSSSSAQGGGSSSSSRSRSSSSAGAASTAAKNGRERADSSASAAPAAGESVQSTGAQGSSSSTSRSSSSSSTSGVGQAAGPQQQHSAEPLSDADFEEVVRFFEDLNRQEQQAQGKQASSSNSSSSEEQQRASSGISSSSSNRSSGDGGRASRVQGRSGDGASEGMDWQMLEQLFLGKGWEQRELAGLEDGMAKVNAAGSKQEAEELWADEVTGVLLALVLQSHRQYLQAPLLPEDMPEEARTAALWEAPFALLVHDDSKEQALEYANKQALDMLGLSSFEEVYSYAAPDFVQDDPQQQQEWLWASAEVEDEYKHTALLPELRLSDPAGCSQVRARGSGALPAGAVAKNVQLFRVDSLEGDPIGTAVLVREWSRGL